MRRWLLGVMLGVLIPSLLQAQSADASLTGRITDPNKTVIAGATITVINSGTGLHYQGFTNETGTYYISDLSPGRYRMEVEKLGFKPVIQSGVVLHVHDALQVNCEM